MRLTYALTRNGRILLVIDPDELARVIGREPGSYRVWRTTLGNDVSQNLSANAPYGRPPDDILTLRSFDIRPGATLERYRRSEFPVVEYLGIAMVLSLSVRVDVTYESSSEVELTRSNAGRCPFFRLVVDELSSL